MNKFIKVCLWICLGCGILGGALLAVGIGFGGSDAWNQGISQVETSSWLKHFGTNVKKLVVMDHDWIDFSNIFNDNEYDYGDAAGCDDYSDSDFDSSLRQTKTYQTTDFTSLDLSVKYGAVDIRKSEDNQIKVVMDSNHATCQFSCKVDNGKLTIQDSRIKYSSANKRRVIIYLPEGYQFDQAIMDIGAGDVQLDTALTVNNYVIDIGAGNLEGKMNVKDCSISCGMGNVDLEGSMTGNVDLSCGMGNVEMDLTGSQSSHNYSLDCGMGSLEVGDVTIAGSGKKEIDNGHSDSTYTISCGMGNVTINFE